MIVKINNKYYYSEKDPIMITLTEEERDHLKKSLNDQLFFVACPIDMRNFEVNEFITNKDEEE